MMTSKQQRHLFAREVQKAYEYASSGVLCPPIGGYASDEEKEQLRRKYALKLACRNFLLRMND